LDDDESNGQNVLGKLVSEVDGPYLSALGQCFVDIIFILGQAEDHDMHQKHSYSQLVNNEEGLFEEKSDLVRVFPGEEDQH
jgi:hypothetical protein